MPIYNNRPRGPAGGDLSGSYPEPQVVNLNGSATGSFLGTFNGEFGVLGDITSSYDSNGFKTGVGIPGASVYSKFHVWENTRKLSSSLERHTQGDYAFVVSQDSRDLAIGGSTGGSAAKAPSGLYIQAFNAPLFLDAIGNDIYLNATAGNTGIGLLSGASEKLHVSGNVKATAFIGSGSQITGITASNIPNFTNDVRNQFTAGPNIIINNGVISGFLTSSFDYIDLNTSASSDPTFKTGRLHYGSASLSSDLEYDTDITGVTLRLGQQLVLRVRNNTATTINKGKIVEVSGSAGSSDVLYVHTASWENDLNSANTIGMVMTDITAGANGYIILNGVLNNINTSGFNAGDMLYLSSSGDYTNIRPPVPYHEVRLGHVARAQVNNGSAFIRIQNGYELDELHDVYAPSASHGDLLMKSGSNNGSQWINSKQLTGSYGLTGSLSIVGSLSASAGVSGSFSGSAANLSVFSTTNGTRGVVPGSNGAGVNFFLRADGTWAQRDSYYLEVYTTGSATFTATNAETQLTNFWAEGDVSNMSLQADNDLRLTSANGNGLYLLNITGLVEVGIESTTRDTIRIKVKDDTGTVLTTFYISPFSAQFVQGQKIHFSHTAIIGMNASRDIRLTHEIVGAAAGESVVMGFVAENARGVHLTLTKI